MTAIASVGPYTLPVQRALARSAVYRLLACLACPDDVALAILREEAWAEVATAAALLPPRVARSLKALTEHLDWPVFAAVQAEHRRLFPHIHSADCPLYETAYSAQHVFQLSQTLADIAGFYRAFGLDRSEVRRERVDHISVETEFMSFLSYKEAQARLACNSEGLHVSRQAQRRFLESHLGHWLPAFARRLETAAGQGVYRDLALVASAFIAAELRHFRIRPHEIEETIPLIDLSPAEAASADDADSCPEAVF